MTAGHPRLPSVLRKQPLQERSRLAVEHVLDTASEIVVEQGTEAFSSSPTILLERSGISRGSFYAFFESPERVLDELARRSMIDSYRQITEHFASRPGSAWTEIIDIMIDHYRYQYRIPLIRELWVGQHLNASIRSLDQIWCAELADLVLEQFRMHPPHFDRLSHLQCAIGIEIIERLAQFAFRNSPQGDETILAESHDVLTGYFAPFE